MSHLYADNDRNHLDNDNSIDNNDHYCQYNVVICSIDDMMLTYVDFKIETGFSILLKICIELNLREIFQKYRKNF